MPFQTNFVLGDNFLDSWENEVAAAGNFRKIKGGGKQMARFIRCIINNCLQHHKIFYC